MEKPVDVATEKRTFEISEDWAIVLLGFLIIGVSLFLFIAPVPGYSWKDSEELSQKVFSAGNLVAILVQFLLTYCVGILATLLTRKPINSFAIVFPMIFFLTLVAQILAGNA